MNFLDLFLASILPVIRVLIMCTLGAVLATERVGVITSEGKHTMSRLVLYVFGPALTLDKLTKSLNPVNMLLWWPLPTFVVANMAVGLLVGFIASRFFATGSSRGVFIASVALGNYGNLPLVLVPAICGDPHGPLHRETNCEERGIAYVMYGQWIAVLAAWTIVWSIMRPPSYQDLELEYNHQTSSTSQLREPSTPASEIVTPGISPKAPPLWRQLLQPPVIAVCVALTLSAIPGVKDALFDPGGVLRPLGGSVETLSGGMIPMIMLILGSGLSRGHRSSNLPPKAIAAAVVCRLLVTPMMGIGLLWGAEKLHILPQKDMVLYTVLVLQQCGPAAVVLGTIANLHRHEIGTTSFILFWQYLLAAPILCMYLMLFFWLYGDDTIIT